MDKRHTTFAGSVPQNYDTYLVPLIFEDYARDIAHRAMAGTPQAVLETAAGTGVVTRKLLDSAPSHAHITATDLNPDMLKICEFKLGEHNNLSLETADALELPFEDDSFDVVVCQFGVMFFPDKLAGMKEARRVLRPGGRFVFSVWDALEKNRHTCVAVEALYEAFPDDPPTFMNVPFGYYDTEAISDSLNAAGFSDIAFTVLPGESQAPSVDHVVKGFLLGSPMAGEIAERVGADTQALEARVGQALAKAHGDAPTRAPMQAIVFEAKLAA